MTDEDPQSEIDLAAAAARARLEEAAQKAERDIQDACNRVIGGIKSSSKSNNVGELSGMKFPNGSSLKYRVERLERDYEKMEKETDGLLQTIPILRTNSEEVIKLNSQFTHHCHDSSARFEKLADRLDAMQLKSQEYYSVVTPQKIQENLAAQSQNEIEIRGLEKRFDEFIVDRVKRLEDTNEKVSAVRDRALSLERLFSEKIEKLKLDWQIELAAQQRALFWKIIGAMGAIAFLLFVVVITLVTHTFGNLP